MKVAYYINFSLLLFVFTLNNFAQQITFEKRYNYGFTENGYSVAQTFDGGYIVAGRHGISFSVSDLLLVKTDSLGNEEWVKFITTGAWEHEGKDIKQTADSGFIITGMTEAMGMGANILIVKTDKNGDTLWTKSYGSLGYDIGNSIIIANDNNYVVACTYQDSIAYLMKLNFNGDTLWTNKYYFSGVLESHLTSLKQTQDSGFVCAGVVYFSNSDSHVLFLSTNKNGDTLFSKQYYRLISQKERGSTIWITNNSEYIISGITPDFAPPFWNFYLVKINNNGDTIWTKTFGGTGDEGGGNVIQTSEGEFLLAGYTYSFGIGNGDVILLKIDVNGNLNWQKTFGGSGIDIGNKIHPCLDGGYVITGTTTSFGSLASVYLIKSDSLGGVLNTNIKFNSKIEINVYPNPASHQLNISYKFVNSSNQNSLIIYNVLGQEIINQTFTNEVGVLSLALDKLENAIYQAVIISNGKIVKTEKISIQK